MLFDKKTKKVVMFGGYNGGHSKNSVFFEIRFSGNRSETTSTKVKNED